MKATGVGPITPNNQRTTPPVVLLHGFDSSCLEFRCALHVHMNMASTNPLNLARVTIAKPGTNRRLHPLLDDHLESFALDVMGWGFSQVGKVR